jgi:hypothetical protein
MRFAPLVLIVSHGLLLAQVIVPDVQPRASDLITRVYPIRHVDPEALRKVLAPFQSKIEIDPTLKALTVKAPVRTMSEIEATLARFDVPSTALRNIEVTGYLLISVDQPAGMLAAELEPVVAKLKNIFNYKGFALLDTQTMRLRPGAPAEAIGMVGKDGEALGKSISKLRVESASIVQDEKGPVVRLDGLRLTLQTLPGASGKTSETGFTTNIDVREGQKVVVGKAKLDGSERTSVLVVTTRIVD